MTHALQLAVNGCCSRVLVPEVLTEGVATGGTAEVATGIVFEC